MPFTLFSEKWVQLLHVQCIICFLKGLGWGMDFHWNRAKFVTWSRLGFCCLPVHKTGHDRALTWDYFSLKLKAKSGRIANGAKRNSALKCHKNAECSETSGWRYFKIGAKMDNLFPKTGRKIPTCSQHSEDKSMFVWYKTTLCSSFLCWLQVVWYGWTAKCLPMRRH